MTPNPYGRPKGSQSLTTLLRKKLSEEFKPGVTYADLLINKLIAVSVKQGNTTALQIVLDRMDGKVPDKIEHQYGPNWRLTFEADPEEGDND
jgi:hypothetical protein